MQVKHLKAKQSQSDGSQKPYYQEVEEEALDDTRLKVNQIVEDAFDSGILKKKRDLMTKLQIDFTAHFMFIKVMNLVKHLLSDLSSVEMDRSLRMSVPLLTTT